MLLLMALVQFIDIWDFMIVMPLGPDIVQALGTDVSHVGWIVSSYAIAATVSGLTVAQFLDRLDRRTALLLCLAGLTLTTGLAALATDLTTLVIVRMLAGFFGGPLIAVSYAVVADVFPESRRGEAMGKVMGSFAFAAILGVPLGLEIANYAGWWAPFVAVAGAGALTALAVRFLLPSMRGHLAKKCTIDRTMWRLVAHRLPQQAFIMMAATTTAAFMIIPNISAHVQLNMHYPRDGLGMLYLCGGVASLVCMRVAGKLADRVGFAPTSLAATVALMAIVYTWFVIVPSVDAALPLFIGFMACMAVRNITANATVSKIPSPAQRAGFMSLISAIQHGFAGVGAFIAARMLNELPSGALDGVELVALLAMALYVILPLGLYTIERQIRARGAQPAVPLPAMD